MNGSNKNLKYIVILGLLLVMVVGFAWLSSTLNLSGTTKISAEEWDIHFANLSVNPDSVDLQSYDSAAVIDPDDDKKVTYSITLTQPGDFYEFTVDVVNDGSLDGMVHLVNSFMSINDGDIVDVTDENLPDYLSYSISYVDGSPIVANYGLAAGASETYKVRIEIPSTISEDELPDATQKIEFGLDVEYTQVTDDVINMVNYKVNHKYKKLTDGYDVEEETLRGEAGSTVIVPVKSKTGFNNPQEQQVTINSDGSTVVDYEYTRKEFSFSITDST